MRNRNPATDADLESDIGDAPDGEKKTPRFTAPCHVHFHHIRKRLADLDNLSVKAVIDGAVYANLFADDSPQQIAKITHSQSQGKPEKTIMTIREIGEGHGSEGSD